MKTTFLTRVMGSGALLVMSAAVAGAQRAGPAPHPAPTPHPAPIQAPRATPATPATRATPATPAKNGKPAERATPAKPATPAQPVQKVKPVPRDADKAEDRAERDALRRADKQSKALLHGLSLTRTERREISVIEKKYDSQYRALRKDVKKDGSNLSLINATRDQERAEIRAVLTPSQLAIFNLNVTKYDLRRR